MFSKVSDVTASLLGQQYIASDEISTVVYLAEKMGKPILAEGPAGVGKTELAKAWAAGSGRELIRLQCYEGLDEAKALYEWEYSKQMLYTQLLRDKLGQVMGEATTLAQAADQLGKEENVFFSKRFLLPRPLLRALMNEKPVVLLIDEIDRADAEFEAFLLEILSDFQISVPELGTIKAVHQPMVVLTSNNTRELSEALKRRALYLYERSSIILRSENCCSEGIADLGQSRPLTVVIQTARTSLFAECAALFVCAEDCEKEAASAPQRSNMVKFETRYGRFDNADRSYFCALNIEERIARNK